ncbi:uncharacterized protein FIBRA_04433 [Fibroporia radiculosa]|uniref:Uncharacterized protein n=1 Tax=Fibroporia radiculosa TaxID=599839 RepID=J4GP88_9APHY|nr:uncharacterized protein FIBRA_04433 [Fibroporia radiculosa]CCM02340.1 predicted protein [Fibroporia radiculosa]
MLPRSKLSRNAATTIQRRLASKNTRKQSQSDFGLIPELPQAAPVLPPPEEQCKIIARRIGKAEREERMDITMSLTPVKTYMGGFTRPRDIRISNWMPGGQYVLREKLYEPPPASAYEPHTVFLVESRYPVRHGIGRADTLEHFVGVCREGDLPAVLARLNSDKAPKDTLQSMDNARWPWMPQKKIRQVKWEEGESREDLLARLLAEDAEVATKLVAEESARQPPQQQTAAPNPRKKATRSELIAKELMHSAPGGGGSRVHHRMFHFSFHASAESDTPLGAPGTFKARTAIPTSSWSRPHKPSQDADDNVVPSYYVERKRQRDAVEERKEEEGGLMAQLSAGILSEGVAAHTKAREEKIPVEVRDPLDGTVRHPSGFEPPTPETHFHPAVAKTATEDHPMMSTVKQHWDALPMNADAREVIGPDNGVAQEFIRKKISEVVDRAEAIPSHTQEEQSPIEMIDLLATGTTTTPEQRRAIPTSSWDSPKKSPRWKQHPEDVVPTYYVERKRQLSSVEERIEAEGNLMAELNEGILSEGLAADIKHRDEKIPVEVRDPLDGTVRHPSGFEPPTPETHFHPTAAKSVTEDHPIVSTIKVPWMDAVSPKNSRSLHTSAVMRATAVPYAAFHLMSPALAQAPQPVQAARQQEDVDEDDHDANLMQTEDIDDETLHVRKQYLPTLGAQPFWRPLLTATFATRPLALTFARLSRGQTRGTPYYVSVSNDDRKYAPSLQSRLRNMRINRMHGLAMDMGRLLNGERGGFLGIRFSPEQRGRAIDGEGMSDPIQMDKRMIQVGVGEWYARVEEVKEQFSEGARDAEVAEAVRVFGLDEHGQRTDDGAWPSRPEPYPRYESLEEYALQQSPPVNLSAMDKKAAKAAKEELVAKHKYEIARLMSLPSNGVIRPYIFKSTQP